MIASQFFCTFRECLLGTFAWDLVVNALVKEGDWTDEVLFGKHAT